jgi:hypothetical protein
MMNNDGTHRSCCGTLSIRQGGIACKVKCQQISENFCFCFKYLLWSRYTSAILLVIRNIHFVAIREARCDYSAVDYLDLEACAHL